MIDFPVLTEELELTVGYLLQKRMSSCGTRAALTIKTAEIVVLFRSLDSPHTELASCVEAVKAAVGAHDVKPAACDNIDVVNWDHHGIAAHVEADNQLLAGARAAMKTSESAKTVADARAVIDSSRKKLARHREVMKYSEAQLVRCEENIVISRLKISLFGRNGQCSPEDAAQAAEDEMRLIAGRRAAIIEEQRIIREAALAITQSADALQMA
jgi:hypothetical protein